MPKRISTLLEVSQEELQLAEVYDCLLDFDNPLHIDPALIGLSGIAEFKNARNELIEYFTMILRLIAASEKSNDLFYKKALKMISTGEGIKTALGYSKDGTKGSGIGPEIGARILATVKSIQIAGTKDPEIFELVGTFEDRVGPDRISDLIAFIIKDQLCQYTERVTKDLKIKKTKQFTLWGGKYNLPINPLDNDYVIFVPSSILSDLPIADKWEDVPIAAEYNSKVRDNLNSILGESWREASKVKKRDLKEVLVNSPETVDELLKLYKARTRYAYNFEIDHLGDLLWDKIGYSIAEKEKLDLEEFKHLTNEGVFAVVERICIQFKNLIEKNGLVNHLYDQSGKKRHERFPQLLLFAIADSYCTANNLDLSREPNAGTGALDFKFSRGLAKSTIEVKYSSNPKLVEGFTKQLKLYNEAEKVEDRSSIYLVIKVNDNNNHKIDEIETIISEHKRLGHPCPSLVVIDGIIKPSASLR